MVQVEARKASPVVTLFQRTAQVFSILFPAVVFITFIMILLGFRLADPAVEIGYVAVLYILAVFYLGGLYAGKIPLWSLILLLAVFVMLFFINVKVYWPIMAASLPGVYRAFSQREKDTAGKVVSIVLAAFLVLIFIPLSMMSCEAYSRNQTFRKQAVSPDGTRAVELVVYPDYRLGGHGEALLYRIYPLSLQRQEKTLAQFKWVSLDIVKQPNGSEKHIVEWDMRWLDENTVSMGSYTLDTVHGPYIDELGGLYPHAAPAPFFDKILPGGRSFRYPPVPLPALVK